MENVEGYCLTQSINVVNNIESLVFLNNGIFWLSISCLLLYSVRLILFQYCCIFMYQLRMLLVALFETCIMSIITPYVLFMSCSFRINKRKICIIVWKSAVKPFLRSWIKIFFFFLEIIVSLELRVSMKFFTTSLSQLSIKRRPWPRDRDGLLPRWGHGGILFKLGIPPMCAAPYPRNKPHSGD